MSEEKLVTVLETPDPVELELGRSLLTKAGIPCTVGEMGPASYITAVMGSGGFAGVKTLQVRESQHEQALDVLEEAWGPADPGEEPAS
jgi:hypothetical protein